jgi:hypothetical protein
MHEAVQMRWKIMSSQSRKQSSIFKGLVAYLQRTPIDKMGTTFMLAGVVPIVILLLIRREQVRVGDFIFADYLAIAWLFLCIGSHGAVSAMRRQVVQVVRIYGTLAIIIGGLIAMMGWGIAIYALVLGLRRVLQW